MNILLGRSSNLAYFGNEQTAVVLDTDLNLIIESGAAVDLLEFADWQTPESQLSDAQERMAARALVSAEDRAVVAAAGRRMYSIPVGAKSEAEKALEWRKENKRGGTPVGLNTARTLAKGGQIGLEKVRHIAKYFPRHEVDKKGKGWAPGEDNFPSNGRIAWALWGGDAAWRWAQAIVDREEKKSVRASGYDLSSTSELDVFQDAHELDGEYGPEFMIRVNTDGSGIDRLYKIDADGELAVWDDDRWDTMGSVYSDISSMDSDIDSVLAATGSRTHVVIDPASAVYVASRLSVDPYSNASVSDIEAEEARMVELGLVEEDWELINRVMTAGGEHNKLTVFAGTTDSAGDGVYSPDERSDNASEQPRDATGRFVTLGGRTVVANDTARGGGVVDSINQKSGKVKVRLDSGKAIEVDAKYLKPESEFDGPTQVPSNSAPLDLSGIIGEPRTPRGQSGAQLPGTLPALTQEDLSVMMRDFPAYVNKTRSGYKLHSDTDKDISVVTKGKQKTAPGLKKYDKGLVKKRWGLDLSTDGLVAAGKTTDEIKEPVDSDVPPKFLAFVSPDDPRSVMDLIALVPASKTSTEPVTYSYKDGKWVLDEIALNDLKSPTPPPVVELDESALEDVISQLSDETKIKPINASVDGTFLKFWDSDPTLNEIIASLTAAGGADRNRGNAEALRRYWTRGKGAAKIRWGTPGDWTRCVRQLSKYMGPRSKGYCQLRHKEVTGVYTGSKLNAGKKKSVNAGAQYFSVDQTLDLRVVELSALAARAADAREKVSLVASATAEQGSKFYIPMIVPEGLESGDGRKFEEGSITMRDLPLPLLWQIKTGSGHDGSVVVGRIDTIERIEGGMGSAYGVFDTGPYGREAERLVRHGFLRGVSVDLDQFEAKEDKRTKTELAEGEEEPNEIGKDKLTINKARIMAVTIVAKPAFQECSISIINEGDEEEPVTPEDGVYEESMEDFADVEPIMASGFLESEIPMTPPADWFERPDFKRPTPLTVDSDGRVYGHIAAWSVNHIGLPRSTKPPRSRSKYAYFHTGVIRTTAGTDVEVGQLTLAGGHAPLNANAASAAKHYDDTASAVADIHVGEDEYGIWCAGSLRPDLEEMQIRALRASAPSGDWRPIQGSLELVAICQVNVPGFPTARAMVASGKVLALVAAGASQMAMMKCSGVACALSTKADLLGQLASTAPDLKIRVREAKKNMRQANLQALTASATDMRERALVAAAIAEMSKISDEERMKLAKKGQAMPDGAFPIRNVDDLKNAIQAYGRAKASERRAVRKHITKQARKLNQERLIPAHWRNIDSMEAAEQLSAMRASIDAVVAAGPKAPEVSDTEIKNIKNLKEDAQEQTDEEIEAAEEVKANKGKPSKVQNEEGELKFVSGVNQPRDAKGKYRKVLARLKQDLGVAGLADVLKKVQGLEDLDFVGDYYESANAMLDLVGMLDRLDTNALNPDALQNIRKTAQAGGKAFANLPLPFGNDNEKLRFSDLPADFKGLIKDMVTRVEAKIGKKDADIATKELVSYMSGGDLYSQAEIQSQFNTMLRLLT